MLNPVNYIYLYFLECGQFAGHANAVITNSFLQQLAGNAVALASNGFPLNPVTIPLEFITAIAQSYQINSGFKSVEKGLHALQSSIGVLQTTTSIIGVLGATTAVLGAVNLYQTLKLKKAVENLELKVENGFIDLEIMPQRKSPESVAIVLPLLSLLREHSSFLARGVDWQIQQLKLHFWQLNQSTLLALLGSKYRLQPWEKDYLP